MYAHVVGKSPNSLALGVPLLASTRRAAAKTGQGAKLVYLPPYNPLRPRFPDRHASLSVSNAIYIAVSATNFVFLRADKATHCRSINAKKGKAARELTRHKRTGGSLARVTQRHRRKKSRLKMTPYRSWFTLHATRRAPQGVSRSVQAMPAWLVKTRRSPSWHHTVSVRAAVFLLPGT